MMKTTGQFKTVGFCDDGIVVSKIREMMALAPVSASEYVVFPGFCDVHVHFREPGQARRRFFVTKYTARRHTLPWRKILKVRTMLRWWRTSVFACILLTSVPIILR